MPGERITFGTASAVRKFAHLRIQLISFHRLLVSLLKLFINSYKTKHRSSNLSDKFICAQQILFVQ